MYKKIEKVVVIGAGTMGAQLAAHFVNSGLKVTLLDIVPNDLTDAEKISCLDKSVRNRYALSAVSKINKIKPAPLFCSAEVASIKVGNIEDDLECIQDADWVVEAVIENLELKCRLYDRIEKFWRAGTIVSSNTSGISLSALAAGRSEDFRKHFLGIHFFNPPRYMHLVEIICTPDTSPEIACFATGICDKVLGKGIVYANDTPNFIANRIGIFNFFNTLKVAVEEGLSFSEVDKLTGALIGRAKSATFRTADLVGLDIVMNVANNIYENAMEDESRSIFMAPEFINHMIQNKWLGEKCGQGFFKKNKVNDRTEIYELDYNKLEYVPQAKTSSQIVEIAKDITDLTKRLYFLLNGKEPHSKFLWRIISDSLLYSANRIPEISDDIVQVDRAIKWGFNWEMGPFELLDSLGVEAVAVRAKSEGKNIPIIIENLLSSGSKSFYEVSSGEHKVFSFLAKEHIKVPETSGVILLKALKDRKKLIKSNSSASLIDLGDGVACLEFHSKMNTIGVDTIAMMYAAIREVENNFEGLVLGNQAENFSAGVNLMMVFMSAQAGDWDELDLMIRTFQNLVMSMRYSEKPVVIAPFGLTLGGGCELMLHADQVCATAETYIGLVEVGVGIIPAGGGTKEMLLRAVDQAKKLKDVDLFPFVKEVFTNIMTAKVFGSAIEARGTYLRDIDLINMNRDRQIADAKRLVLSLAANGYHKPKQRDDIPVLGESARATLKLGAHLMMRAGYATDYDVLIADKVASVLTGGCLTHTAYVSEQYLLDLEREHFLSLLGESKTQDRMRSFLKTGKPLRN